MCERRLYGHSVLELRFDGLSCAVKLHIKSGHHLCQWNRPGECEQLCTLRASTGNLLEVDISGGLAHSQMPVSLPNVKVELGWEGSKEHRNGIVDRTVTDL